MLKLFRKMLTEVRIRLPMGCLKMTIRILNTKNIDLEQRELSFTGVLTDLNDSPLRHQGGLNIK